MATVALIYLEIQWNPEGISNVKSIINKYNSRELNLSSKICYCETFEKNKQTITFNVLYTKEKYICPAYISKINSNYEKRIILLMITNAEKEGRHYLAVKKISALLRGIT